MKKVLCFAFLCMICTVATAQLDVTNNGLLFISSTIDTFSVKSNFTNSAAATLTNNSRFFVHQNYTNQQASGIITGETILNGNGIQTINTLANASFNKLTVNKAAGLASLANAITISSNLELLAGKLSILNNDLTIGNTASITGGSAASYIVATGTGVVKQQIVNNTAKLFPVGLANDYTPATISLSLASATDVFNVRMLPMVYSNGTSGSIMQTNSVNATWMISEEVNGGSDASITCQWPASLELPGFNRLFSRLAHYTSSQWDYGLINLIPIGVDPYAITRTGFTNFSPFVVTMNMAVLPNKSIQLNGKNSGNENVLNWIVAEEPSVAYYIVEASTNGTQFLEVGTVKAVGYNSNERNYQFVHKEINGQSYYYRIRQVEVNGQFSFSKTIPIYRSAASGISIYPNPAKDKTTLQFMLANESVLTLLISNSLGKVVYAAKQNYKKGAHSIPVTISHLPAATYFLQLKDKNGVTQHASFIKIN